MQRIFSKIFVAVLVSCFVIGCSGNPTNEPSEADIQSAVDNKFKKIDEDPTLTPEQKAEMKKHMSGPAQSAGR